MAFESKPGFIVPALVYLPRGACPWPWVFVASGHYPESKAAEDHQRLGVLCARYGLASICIDPISQGERSMFPGRDGKPRTWASVEHQLEGPASILMGTNLARYMMWEAIRALDYLETRPDVLRDRIGCTGVSGGGTLSSYLMAVDDRVRAAAPGCWTTHHRQLLAEMGPDDAEQQIHAQLAGGTRLRGFRHHAGACAHPVPCLHARFFQHRDGTWDTFRAIKRVYTRLGHADAIDLYEADAEHGFVAELRIACVRWMLKQLCGRDEVVREEPFDVRPPETLRCFPRGQVVFLPGSRTLFDLYRDQECELAAERAHRAAGRDTSEFLQTMRSLASVRSLERIPPPRVSLHGERRDARCAPRRIVLWHDGDIPLPAWEFPPEGETAGATILIHERGKTAIARSVEELNALRASGQLVVAVDLPGTGETQRRTARRDWMRCLGPNWQESFLAYMLGTTLLGLRIEGLPVWSRYLRESAPHPYPSGIRVVATGDVGVAALHAMAVEGGLFDHLELRRSLASWASVVRCGPTKGQIANVIHGALLHYDLPDLAAAVPASKLVIRDPRDATGAAEEADDAP